MTISEKPGRLALVVAILAVLYYGLGAIDHAIQVVGHIMNGVAK